MPPSRRAFLASSATVSCLAGCVSLPGGDDEPTGQSDPDSTSDTPEGALELSFGEGAAFTNDQGVKLAVEMANPRLRETVPVVRDGEVIVDSPESTQYFLFVAVTVVNEGDSSIKPPSGLYFDTDGEEVERTFIRTPGPKYRDIGELAAGESATATIAFAAPAGAEAGTVALRFQTLLESPPARWTFDYADVPKQAADLTRDGLGDTQTVGKDGYAYSFTPTEVRTTTAYTYGDGNEHTAPDGSQFVLLSVNTENVGKEAVKLPTPYDIRLDADGSVVRAGRFKRAEERYPGRADLTPPGESLSGVLLYEVPASASSFTVRLAVGNQTFSTWPIEAESS